MGITGKAMRSRLYAYVDLRKELRMQSARLEQMRADLGTIGAQQYNADSPSSSLPSDGAAREVVALERLEERVRDLAATEHDEHAALELIIQGVSNAQQRALLRMRYFDLYDWKDLAFSLYGDNADFLDQEPEYVSKCYHLHTRAIGSMVAVCRKRRESVPKDPPNSKK